MTRRGLLLAACAPALRAEEVRVRVLELFHPETAEISALEGRRIKLETEAGAWTLEGAQSYRATLQGGVARSLAGPVRVRLGGKIERIYPGRLEITPEGTELRLVATLPLEAAVAAIVAAEAGASAPEEAQKAQAIAVRSFLLAAKGRHDGYAFCDTTHCHHLTESEDRSERAAASTAGLCLFYGGRPLEALSMRRCGGITRTLDEVGLRGSGYPYFPVACEPCRRNPSPWTRSWPMEQADAVVERPGAEAARLKVVRRLGWSAIPSNDYSVRVEAGKAVFEGRGEGHGVGLCQFGAAELARQGWDARRILAHYFLNATVA
ncbi:MAG: SpoIID/LytB domain-containing protein [Bryobacterales bacterium]